MKPSELKKKTRDLFADPHAWKVFHGGMVVAWIFLIPVSIILQDSTPWVVAMSHLAIVYSALACYQAARAELESSNNPPKENDGNGSDRTERGGGAER